ncbi:MAG: ethanolamine ammonia-lyase subunit EutC [Phenylobacterium sp.]
MTAPVPPDPWSRLAALTPARIALGRTGASLPTREVLAFSLAHARARDAVHAAFDDMALGQAIEAVGFQTVGVESAAPDRATYLRRPDLGRRLSDESRRRFAGRGPYDLAVVVADGLSSPAVHAHAAPMLAALKPLIAVHGWGLAPIMIARQVRVALGDEIGDMLGARMLVMLIGERPGLSSPDSLGAYLTFGPRVGRSDAERNCVSNIRAEGLSYAVAAARIAWLAREGLRLGLTGVALKDESELDALAPHASNLALGPDGC